MSWTFRNTINPSHGLAMQVGQLLPSSPYIHAFHPRQQCGAIQLPLHRLLSSTQSKPTLLEPLAPYPVPARVEPENLEHRATTIDQHEPLPTRRHCAAVRRARCLVPPARLMSPLSSVSWGAVSESDGTPDQNNGLLWPLAFMKAGQQREMHLAFTAWGLSIYELGGVVTVTLSDERCRGRTSSTRGPTTRTRRGRHLK